MVGISDSHDDCSATDTDKNKLIDKQDVDGLIEHLKQAQSIARDFHKHKRGDSHYVAQTSDQFLGRAITALQSQQAQIDELQRRLGESEARDVSHVAEVARLNKLLVSEMRWHKARQKKESKHGKSDASYKRLSTHRNRAKVINQALTHKEKG